MTEKGFIRPDKDCRVIKNIQTGETAIYYDTEDGLMFLKWLNNLSDENEQLKLEINMLKTTIARNEAYIKRLTQTSEWRTSAYD